MEVINLTNKDFDGIGQVKMEVEKKICSENYTHFKLPGESPLEVGVIGVEIEPKCKNCTKSESQCSCVSCSALVVASVLLITIICMIMSCIGIDFFA